MHKLVRVNSKTSFTYKDEVGKWRMDFSRDALLEKLKCPNKLPPCLADENSAACPQRHRTSMRE